MALYLVRHGQTRWNVERRLQGRTDSPLTLVGLEQVRGYGELLRTVLAEGDDVAICASPLPRARQTASILAEMLRIPDARCDESELLAERYCGAWEGQKREELAQRFGEEVVRAWRQWDARIGGDGETLGEVQQRAHQWLARPRSAAHVVVVTHGIMSRQFRGAYLGLDPGATLRLESHQQDRIYRLDAGALTTLQVEPPDPEAASGGGR